MGPPAEVNPSLWVADDEGPTFDPLAGDGDADVVVIGAGIAGLTVARVLVDHGLDVVVLEARRVCTGATGFTTAKVTALHRLIYAELVERHGEERTRAYAEANRTAVEQVAAFVEHDGIDCDLVRAPAITYTAQDDRVQHLEQEVDAANRVGLALELTTATTLPFPVKAAVRLEQQLHVHPRRYCLGLSAGISARGGRIHELTRARRVDRHGARVEVVTDHGVVRAGHAVVATHLPFLDRGGYFARAHPYRSYALSARVQHPVPTEMCISAEEPTRSCRPAPGGRIIVGGEGHKTGQEPDTRRCYRALEAWANDTFGVEAIEHRWSAQDYQTVDGLPYIGRLTRRDDNVLIATGFRKWGMTNGTAAGYLLADAILDRENPWAEAFDSTRVAPKQSLVAFMRENANVALRFVGDRLTALRPGTPNAPTCSHLGCRLTYNTADESWDCPCHGSRFDRHGGVLEGPALRDVSVPTHDS